MPLLVTVNCPDIESAREIAEALVGERLAASANIGGVIESVYHWQGAVARTGEIPLLLKTRAALWERVSDRIRALHPYECPGIWGAAPERIDPAFAHWLATETTD